MEDFTCAAKIGESLLGEEPFQNLTVKKTGLALADLAFLCQGQMEIRSTLLTVLSDTGRGRRGDRGSRGRGEGPQGRMGWGGGSLLGWSGQPL